MIRAPFSVHAPGKMLLTGSYAVLEGAPAIVCAIDRRAVARAPSGLPPAREITAAIAGAPPDVDVAALCQGGAKLGLGSSSAAVVAALGYQAAARGEDLADPAVRGRLFEAARAAHAQAQGGGSGVDCAASVYGGALRFRLEGGGRASVTPVSLPTELRVDAYWSGRGARTSDMLARVRALRARSPEVFAARMSDLAGAARAADDAIAVGDAAAFVRAAERGGHALDALGRDADVPIVLPEVLPLVSEAAGEAAAFVPSGAGGGDVFVRLGRGDPSARFDAAAHAAGFTRLDLGLDCLGIVVDPGQGDARP